MGDHFKIRTGGIENLVDLLCDFPDPVDLGLVEQTRHDLFGSKIAQATRDETG